MTSFKIILPFILLLPLFSLQALEDQKGWILDTKTSTLIPDYLGKIKVISGEANIGERELKKGSKVYNNELIHTKTKSYIVLEMIDLTTITLGPNSDFKIEDWNYHTKNDRNAVFSVIKGQWRAIVRSKAKEPNQLKIKSGFVSLGIRGTELMVNVFENKQKKVVQVALLAGAIHVDNAAAGSKADLVPGDHEIYIEDQNGKTEEHRKISDEEFSHFKNFLEPEIPTLLEPIAISDNLDESNVEQSPAYKNLIVNPSNQTIKDKTFKDQLKILNETREENKK